MKLEEQNPDALAIEYAYSGSPSPDEESLRLLLLHVAGSEDTSLRHLTVVLADRALVLRLNREHLDHDDPTDVLAFPLGEEAGIVDGEIYVDLDTAAERCDEFGATPQEEACRYAVHGLLHLIGYRDKTESGQQEMRSLEDRYLASVSSSG